MDSLVMWLIVICLLILILYKYSTRNFTYWTKRGVKQLNPIPILGDNRVFFNKLDPITQCQYYYEPFKSNRFGGLYFGTVPFLSVTDPELIKLIFVKDADHFVNRHDWSYGSDPLITDNLIGLKDENWRKMRAVMTTVFTSAKMKDMFCFMNDCAKHSLEFMEAKASDHYNSGKGSYEMEFFDFFSRYGTDVIGSTAFGIEVDSFKNPDNEFYRGVVDIRNIFTGLSIVKIIFMNMFPALSKKLGFSFLGDKSTNFFTSLVDETIREREEKNIIRKDVIHVLMEARKGKGTAELGELVKGKLPDLTNRDITAQVLFFFFGGFETMAQLLGFIVYELAVNPDVQETLLEEIDQVIEKENGITYDGIMHEMPYLNMVINETLRKWPPAAMTDRTASRSYTIPKTDVSPEITLKRDDSIWVSIAALHYDPEYFPDPHKFDPERFRDEKNTIKPFTFLPFGEGIRHCIGMRYAIMEVKTILVHILRKYTLEPSEKTLIPMRLSTRKPLTLEPENGFWLGIKPRKLI